MTTVRQPTGLGKAGATVWRQVVADLPSSEEFTAAELLILAAAARQADDVARLEATIAIDGAVVTGAAGQPRMNSALTEVRQGRLALAKLLGQLAIPEDDAAAVTTPAQQRARKAARSRWDRQNHLSEVSG